MLKMMVMMVVMIGGCAGRTVEPGLRSPREPTRPAIARHQDVPAAPVETTEDGRPIVRIDVPIFCSTAPGRPDIGQCRDSMPECVASRSGDDGDCKATGAAACFTPVNLVTAYEARACAPSIMQCEVDMGILRSHADWIIRETRCFVVRLKGVE